MAESQADCLLFVCGGSLVRGNSVRFPAGGTNLMKEGETHTNTHTHTHTHTHTLWEPLGASSSAPGPRESQLCASWPPDQQGAVLLSCVCSGFCASVLVCVRVHEYVCMDEYMSVWMRVRMSA